MSDSLTTKAAAIPKFKKERFLLSLTEDDFRQRIVRPLMFRQGLREASGKDDASRKSGYDFFLASSVLGFEELYAVWPRRGSLNLSLQGKDDISEAIAHLAAALHLKVAFAGSGDKYVNKAILCTSGRVNKAARTRIGNAVDATRIVFLDAEDLIPRLDVILPELWFDLDTAARPYLTAIRKSVEDIDEDLLPGDSQDHLSAASDKGFVTLYLNRRTIKVVRKKGRIEREPDIQELPIHGLLSKKDRLVLITGGAGSGKSTALRRLAYLIATKSLDSREERQIIPVLIRASALLGPSDVVQSVASETARLTGTTQSAFSTIDLREGSVTLLIDGLDELADDESRTAALQKLLAFAAHYPDCQIVVSSRDYAFLNILPEMSSFSRFQLTPIGLKQAEQLLQRLHKTRHLPVDNSREILRRLQDVHGLELNPLLVTVFAATSDYSRKDIPANITELFKKYTEMMLGRWDASKGLAQQFHAPLKDFLMCRLAFEMHRRQETSLPVSELSHILSSELENRGFQGDVTELLDELIVRSGLFRTIGDSIEFRHLLLQEFFAGRGIESIEFLQSVVSDEWWQRATIFYFGEHPGDAKALDTIRDAVDHATVQERFRAAIAVGLSLQACYLVETKHKAVMVQWVLEVLAESKQGFIEAAIQERVPPLVAFIYYFMFGKDSVIGYLPHATMKDVLQLLLSSGTADERETRHFWWFVSAMESGRLEDIEDDIRKFHPEDARLSFALFLAARFVERLRISSKAERKAAGRIADRLQTRVPALLAQFEKQFKSVLLEVRQGQIEEVTVIDADTADEETGDD